MSPDLMNMVWCGSPDVEDEAEVKVEVEVHVC